MHADPQQPLTIPRRLQRPPLPLRYCYADRLRRRSLAWAAERIPPVVRILPLMRYYQ